MSAAPVVIAAPRQKQLLTPEGVPIQVEVAAMGDRCLAFLVDCLLQALVMVGVFFLGWAVSSLLGGWGLAVFFLLFFLVRNFYFTFFEIRWQGTTPGKRWRRIRVISRYGRSLTGEAVFARNLTREVEIFWPLLLLLFGDEVMPGAPPWVGLATSAWIMVFAFLPFLNQDRLRVGDLIAGTLVVSSPRAALLTDMSTQGGAARRQVGEARYTFTSQQLSIYGIYELQVLEEVLRMDSRNRKKAARVVSEKIRTKIDWPREQWRVDDEAFLHDFYAAQRAHLEQGLLMGQRVESKKRS